MKYLGTRGFFSCMQPDASMLNVFGQSQKQKTDAEQSRLLNAH